MARHVPILIVEDDDELRETLEAALDVAGYEVRSARNGEEALTVLREGFHPAVITVDIMMPVMDGYELLRRLQADPELRNIPVVVATATAYSRSIVGEVSFLRKPFKIEQLLRVVRQWSSE